MSDTTGAGSVIRDVKHLVTKDSKLIVGVTSVVFGVLHWVLLLVLIVTAGGSCMSRMSFFFLEYPLMVMWPPDTANPPAIYIPYVLIGGTVMYMLAGVPVGLAICGVKRLFKWLNDEKWTNDA